MTLSHVFGCVYKNNCVEKLILNHGTVLNILAKLKWMLAIGNYLSFNVYPRSTKYRYNNTVITVLESMIMGGGGGGGGGIL